MGEKEQKKQTPWKREKCKKVLRRKKGKKNAKSAAQKKIPGKFQEQFFLMDLKNCTPDVSESLYDHFRGALSYS